MRELAANCGRVSRDLMVAKALSARERKERPNISAEELREQTPNEIESGMTETFIGEFDVDNDDEWAIPGMKLKEEETDNEIQQNDQSTSSSSTKTWLTFAKRE